MPMEPPILEIEHLSKALPKGVVLDDVSLQVARGSIHGVIGETGSGRHTLMKILAGVHPAGSYEGRILLDGALLALAEPRDAIRAGIGVVPRRGGVFDQLTVAENVVVTSWQVRRRFLIVRSQIEREAQGILEEWGIDADPSVPAMRLNAAQRRQVMIARALCIKPRLVVLEEPMADLSSARAISQVLWLVRRMAERGLTVLYMARRPADTFQVADRVTVLRDGTVAGSWERAAFDEGAVLAAEMSQRLADLGDIEGELAEEPRGMFGALSDSLYRLFRGGR